MEGVLIGRVAIEVGTPMSEALNLIKSPALYYFVFKHDVITIDYSIVIARPGGNVIAKHDEFSNSLICYLDKGNSEKSSSHKVTINGIELKEGDSVALKVGDILAIGQDSYKFFDNFEEAEKQVPMRNRRKYKRPNSAYAISNLFNFYCSPPLALCLFALIYAYAIYRHVPFLKLQAPEHLQFLSDKYQHDYLQSFLLTTVATWFVCLVYSFIMYSYFNRNSVRIASATVAFSLISIVTVHWVSLPLNHIRNYVQTREVAWNHENKLNDKAISHIFKLEKYKKGIVRSYKHLKNYGTPEEQEILRKDHDDTIKKIESEDIEELGATKNKRYGS